MWHLTAFKISISLSFFNLIKNEMIFYRISELMFATLIQRYNKKYFISGFYGIQNMHSVHKIHCHMNCLSFETSDF